MLISGKHTTPHQRFIHRESALHLQYDIPTFQAIPQGEAAIAAGVHRQRLGEAASVCRRQMLAGGLRGHPYPPQSHWPPVAGTANDV